MAARIFTVITMRPGYRLIAAIAGVAICAQACIPGIWGREDGGGNGANVPVHTCREQCGSTADCQSDWECRDRHCVATSSTVTQCANDDDCQIAASGWAGHECDAGADCPGQVCVAFAGSHYCAIQPSATVDCSFLHMTEVQLTQLGGGPVSVCANLEWKCEGSVCVFRCTGDSSCSGLYPVCNTASGECQCRSSPDSCGPNTSGGSVCVGGACGCREDKDCVGDGYDKCYGGRCGCAATASCDDFSKLHPGTTVVCE
ncbi:MAG: hypothetical protein JXR83_19285 [Deltaproteobacteria bacterium]|nr:hypothetical protein [Deltaproteobacteria bacterium]